MPKTLTLPDDLYETLKEKSKERGAKPEDYALELLKNEITMEIKKRTSGVSVNLYNLAKDLRLGRHRLSNQEADQLDIELREALENQPPHFPTVEDSMSWSRGYPWRKDDSD